jgi:hypothetical protein
LRVEKFFAIWPIMAMLQRIPVSSAAERRIRREARSATLREQALALRQAGWTYAAIGEQLGLSLERARQIVRKAEWLTSSPRWFDGLPVRAQHTLYARGLTSLPEIEAARAVARLTPRELMSAPNVGRGAGDTVVAWLARHGLTLRPEAPRTPRIRIQPKKGDQHL